MFGHENGVGQSIWRGVPTEVQDIIEEFADVFETPTELPPTKGIDHGIS